MLSGPVKADASGVKNQWHYERHRPEQSLLYQTVERVYPDFLEQLAGQGKSIPRYVQREFEDYLKCGRLEHGFLRAAGFLSELRSPTHGGKCRLTDR
jgi:hypothetical protein